MLGASLAKGFGAPVAILAGEPNIVRRFNDYAETRVHCSQPSMAAIAAAVRALALNASVGDPIRTRLAALISRFRIGLAKLGHPTRSGFFPVVTTDLGEHAPAVHDRLRRVGVSAALHRDWHSDRPAISFLITARHQPREIDDALASLSRALDSSRPTARPAFLVGPR